MLNGCCVYFNSFNTALLLSDYVVWKFVATYEVISDFWTLQLNDSFFAGLGKNNIFFFFITSVHLFFTLTTVDDILELE